MNSSDKAGIQNFHNKVIAEFGIGSIDAVGWVSHASQHARYKILSQLGDFTGKSVIDAGCGHADLLPWLSLAYDGIRYIGIDQLPALLNIAIERYDHLAEASFLSCDFSETVLPFADYVIACGSLSYRNSDPNYIFTMIEKLFAHARLGFGFNLLSAIEYPDPAIVFYRPDVITGFCKTLTTNVILKEGYWKNDFTVFMYP